MIDFLSSVVFKQLSTECYIVANKSIIHYTLMYVKYILTFTYIRQVKKMTIQNEKKCSNSKQYIFTMFFSFVINRLYGIITIYR